jgi:phosphate transport system permease protein
VTTTNPAPAVPGLGPHAGSDLRARRRKAADRAATWIVSAGGVGIILVILGILAFIVHEVWPLMRPSRAWEEAAIEHPGLVPLAVAADDHGTLLAALGTDGALWTFRRDGGAAPERTLLVPSAGPPVLGWASPGRAEGGFLTAKGQAVALELAFRTSFSERGRQVEIREPRPVVVDLELPGPAVLATGRVGEGGGAVIAAALADGRIHVVSLVVRENAFTGETGTESTRSLLEAPGPISALLLDQEARRLYAAVGSRVCEWEIGGAADPGSGAVGSAAITALSLLKGDVSLLVGREDGSVEVHIHASPDAGPRRLVKIREFPRRPAPILRLEPSRRDKGFIAADAAGGLGLYHSTSSRVLWEGSLPGPPPLLLGAWPRGDGIDLAGPGRTRVLRVENPHPEASLSAFFARVWYEDHDRPAHVWQSSSGHDEYEPKLGMVPLLFGTLKGTVFSLLLAIPAGVLAAIFTSQFLHPRLRRTVKPAVEIMASLPSVVLGFVAGLWLAPRVERVLPGILLLLLVAPIAVIAAGVVFRRLPLAIKARLPDWAEVAVYGGALVAAGILSISLSPVLAEQVFGGDHRRWLQEALGLRYDQRNALVVSLAMGFAVIPIIFTISEDALSNVPRGLTLGSVALGADAWTTVRRVVLPTASPGIFSAIMVGFGRAVGETMIVLMATGNTPILEWNPFNGFRTLSANIAQEIPEAAVGSTLYRTLFLAALLLFAVNFTVNTVAETVRQRLMRRYGSL